MASIRQASFAGGELAPELWGRTDLARHAMALRRCRNFLPARSGAAVSRPGTEYRGALKFSTSKVRLVPFLYSAGGTVTPYLLEFGDLYVRPWRAYSNYDSLGTEKATPFSASELDKLGWAQEGNTLTLSHPSHPPQELKFDGTTWTLSALSFTLPSPGVYIQAIPNLAKGDADHPPKEWQWAATQLERDPDGNVLESQPIYADLTPLFNTLNPPAYDPAHTYALYDMVSYSGAYYLSLSDSNTGNTPGRQGGVESFYWQPFDSSAPPVVCAPDRPVHFSCFGTVSSLMGGDPFGFRWYRGVKNGPLGWVGDSGSPFGTNSDTNTFTDIGDDPDYTTAPPQGLNPFDRSGTVENPNAVGFYEGRRIFGGTATRPQNLFASAIAHYSNFDKAVVPRKDDGMVFALASGRAEQIRSITWLSDLLVLTGSSIWAVSGGDGPLAFDSVQAVPQSQIGSSWLPGIPAGRSLLYVRDGGGGVRSLAYSWERQGYTDLDLSLIAQHLVRGHSVVDWAYAAEPWSVVWAAREDGKLLSITLARDEQEQEEGVLAQGGGIRYAWAWHDTDGAVESVCSLRVDGEDAIYLAVARTVNGSTARYLERLSSRALTLDSDGNVVVADAYALDCAITKTLAPDPPSATFGGLSHLEGLQVYAVGDGNVMGPYTVTGGSITLDVAVSKVHVGLAFTPELELLDVAVQGAELRTKQKTLKEVSVEVVQSRGLLVGPDADHLTEWRQRTVADSYGPIPYATETARISVMGGFNNNARAFIRQGQPLPVAVVAVTREVVFGG